MPASVAGNFTLRFSRSERYAVVDRDPYDDSELDGFLRQILAPIVEACAVLDNADSAWAEYWCGLEGTNTAGYWDFQGDGQQRPKKAMDDLATQLITLFEGVSEEDKDALAEELRRLLDACTFLGNFRGGWEGD